MKKFYRRGDGCGRDGKIYESCIEIYKPKGEVCELGDEIYELSGGTRDFGDEIYGLIDTVYNRIRERFCGAKAAVGDV